MNSDLAIKTNKREGWRTASLLLALLLSIPSFWFPASRAYADPSPGAMEGSGTPSDPYIITDAAQFNGMRSDLNAHYKLGADIALTGQWETIGWDADWWMYRPFTGQLDGDDHTVSGLHIATTDFFMYSGLFGIVGAEAVVKNIRFEGVRIEDGSFMSQGVGTVAGELQGTLTNVHVGVGSVSGPNQVGGLAGLAGPGSLIGGSSSNADVSGPDPDSGASSYNVGGLVGKLQGRIENSGSSGSVAGGPFGFNTGGLAGMAEGASIYRGYAIGGVSGSDNTGGLVGEAAASDIGESRAEGDVLGTSSGVGGLIGKLDGGTVSRSYAKGDVGGPAMFVGGLVGYMSGDAAVTESYSAGRVEDTWSAGGLVGTKDSGSVVSSYYDAQKSGRSDEDRGTPKPTEALGREATYDAAWDFASRWILDDREGYPSLAYADTTPPAVKEAYIADEAPDRVAVVFHERIAAEQDALDRLQASVDGNPVAVVSAAAVGERRVDLTLAQAVTARNTVVVQYDASHPIADLAGNRMADASIPAVNNVQSSLTALQLSPAGGSANVPADAELTLTFSEPVTAVPGKQIRIRKLSGDGLVETIAADDGAKVRIANETATLRPAADWSYSTGYYVQIDPGAFQSADGEPFSGFSSPTAWPFETERETGKTWIHVGQSPIAGSADSPSLYASDGVLYASYRDNSASGKLSVVKFDETRGAWELVGPQGFTGGAAKSPSLFAENGTLYAAYLDASRSGRATVMTFDAASDEWTVVGAPGFTPGSADEPSLFVYGGVPYVAFIDKSHGDKAAVMKYDDILGWVPVGTSVLSEDTVYSPSLTVYEGVPYLAYQDYRYAVGFGATVVKYDELAGEWQKVGEPGFTQGLAFETTLRVSNGTPYVAYENDQQKAAVMKYDSVPGRWVQVGSSGFSADQAYEISLFVDGDEPYAAYWEWGTGKLSVLKYTGLRWAYVGESRFTAGRAYQPSLVVADGVPYVMFVDAADRASVMKFGTAADAAPTVASYSPISGSAGVAVDSNLQLIFSENVEAASGKTISIRKASDNSVVETLNASDPAAVRVDGNTVTIDPAQNLSYGTAYYVLIEPGAFRSLVGRNYAGISDAAAWTFGTRAAPPADSRDNADLSGLALSSGSLNPAFDPAVLAYSASVPNAVDRVTVTAAVYDPEASLKVNGITVPGGSPSPAIGLAAGSNTIKVEVTAQDDVTSKTYFIAVTRQPRGSQGGNPSNGSSSDGSDGGSSVDESPADKPDQEAGFDIVVNGRTTGRIAASSETVEAGRTLVTVHVDSARLQERLAGEGNETIVVVAVRNAADAVSVELPGDALKALADKRAVFVVETPNGSYRLPALNVPIDRGLALFGEEIELAGTTVRATISRSDAAAASKLDLLSETGGFDVVVPPVDYEVTLEYEGRMVKLDRFDAYVERDIPLPEGYDSSRVTTAVVLEADGKLRHVPTYVTERDGKVYAIVRSFTNSSYALIYNSVAFKDMQVHWARTAVNDLASRLIVTGVDGERFNPLASITRAEFAAIIVRALGLVLPESGKAYPFTDVREEDWYAGSVASAAEYGLVLGYKDGSFRPGETITREEAIVMAVRAMRIAGSEPAVGEAETAATLASVQGGGQVSAWARQAVASALRLGIVESSNAELKPNEKIARAETAALIRNLLIAAKLINPNR
ncbi:Ig-like domain-containing protein [Cohnella cellulosilytica]|uniref:Ig-like domain-containing protein n=1 Tax=Cohnella cellulosilytica TaxID=986710 RepID=A0ABW2FDY7_9BACL